MFVHYSLESSMHSMHMFMSLLQYLKIGSSQCYTTNKKRRISLGMVRVVVAAIVLLITWCALHWTHMVLSQ